MTGVDRTATENALAGAHRKITQVADALTEAIGTCVRAARPAQKRVTVT
jgi:hypothetical protein